jgi:F420-dependent oxidoreductase-like protein
MLLGANVGYFGMLGPVAEELRFAQESERLGYDSVWVGEPYGNDAATVLAWFAGATSRIRLGSAILAIPGRTPAMTGQTAATIDAISGGRLLLGLGTSGPQVSEGWHGVRFGRQLQRTREYVDVVRMVLRREVVQYDGQTIQLPLPDGPGKALKLIMRPVRAEVPIYLAALGPKNVALCGEIADGWLPLWWAPEYADRLAQPLREGQETAGRAPNSVKIVPNVMVRIDDNEQAARDLVAPMLALYVGGMGSREQNFYNRLIGSYGYEDIAKRVQDRYLDGHKAEAAALIPDDLVDLVCLTGSPDRVADRLRAYADAGADTLMGIPAAFSHEDRLTQLRLLAEAAERSGVVSTASEEIFSGNEIVAPPRL